MNSLNHLYDKYLIRAANSIYHDEYRSYLVESGCLERLMTDGYSQMDQQEAYLDFYLQWIQSSQLNRIQGLQAYPYRFISLGCTQALDEFHYWCSQKNKRIRMFRGEYPYNRDCIQFDWDTDFIESSPLQNGDAVIISSPFSGSGCVHPQWDELLAECETKNIPIMVDCAFFGTCQGVEINLDHPAIMQVAFSTTKGLSCGNYRNGILFTKSNEGHLSVQTEWHHGIHFNVAIGLELMRKFSPDHLVKVYGEAYKQTCNLLGLKETQCVHLALGDDQWEFFSRDGVYNRVGLKNIVRDYKRALNKGEKFQIPDQ